MIPAKAAKWPTKIIARRTLFILLAAAACVLEADDSAFVMNRYVSMAIQGDLANAEALFSESQLDQRSPGAALWASYRERFVQTSDEPRGGLPGEVVSAYERYWRQSLLDAGRHSAYAKELDQQLAKLLQSGKTESPAIREAPALLAAALEEQNLFHFQSEDPPLRDLLVWNSQYSREYSVQLTDNHLGLTVHFLDEFLLQGWKEYASLGLTSTTGWVEDGDLYCIAWAYDLDSENFKVSYLKHEARHLVDLERYPHMDSTELEYRAKLTELAFAHRTLTRVLENFSEKSAQNPESPHSMANWRVVRDMYWHLFEEEMAENFDDWGQLRGEDVNRAARTLIALNTEKHDRLINEEP